ncbi:MAG: HAMP domain-containing histidine kinase [Saprospiraceae bacterium]|nr:HAMP domain-containing histidine kinase [Saprospiraceae bacterium]
MNRKIIIFIIIGVTISLIGLVGMQLHWIQNAITIEKANFNRSVNEALSIVVQKHERIETEKLVQQRMSTFKQGQLIMKKLDSINRSLNYQNNPESPITSSQNSISIVSKNPLTLNVRNSINGKIIDTSIVFPESPQDVVLAQEAFNDKKKLQKSCAEECAEDCLEDKVDDYYNWLNQSSVLNALFKNMMDFRLFQDNQIEPDFFILDSLIKSELYSKGIETKFEYGVFSSYANKLIFQKSGDYKKELISQARGFNLFPGSFVSNPNYLMVYFPNEKRYLLLQMGGMLSISVILIFVLIFLFTYTINTIIKQKKLSEMKNDFINNMTHEFKTPIATVSLACEALNDKEIPKSNELYNNYIGIINEENTRLGTLAEKILQTAIIDKGELKLNKELLNINDIITEVVANIKIQVETRNGNIETILSAENIMIRADKLHMTNVIYNLLDNANKYTPENPELIISTENIANGIVISVKDNGVGISKQNQKKIFDKLYRVPRGNIHDVKGFGLGLSYVKAIVEEHHGSISLESELDKGSTFRVFLPQED